MPAVPLLLLVLRRRVMVVIVACPWTLAVRGALWRVVQRRRLWHGERFESRRLVVLVLVMVVVGREGA